jgi:hypothetical protein
MQTCVGNPLKSNFGFDSSGTSSSIGFILFF